MNRLAAFFALIVLLASCGEKKNIPDVSAIRVQTDVKRFDEDFFAADTTKTEAYLNAMQQKYPSFLKDYLYNILALPPQPDSAVARMKMFLHDYRLIYDSAQVLFTSFEKTQKEINHAFQFVKYYFPGYKLPEHLITFIGPVEGYGNVLTSEGLAIGLQLYLGRDFPVYHTDYINAVYPEYQSRRFEPQYIPVNCIKNIIDDIYPESTPGMPLAYQMVEAGKKLYILDQLMPETADSLKTGYTQKQLDGCFENEGLIWNYFLQNNLLYETDPALTRDYMNDGPKTELMGEASPGFIGQFVGWQIVKKWMENNKQKTLTELLHTPAKQIFEEARYKPR